MFSLSKDKVLIGTQDWEYKAGVGCQRGYRWGNGTVQVSAEYEWGRGKARTRRGGGGASEASVPELEVVPKINNAFGVTSKATDWAPEVGVMFRI